MSERTHGLEVQRTVFSNGEDTAEMRLFTARCRRCPTTIQTAEPTPDGIKALGWQYDDKRGWLCPAHAIPHQEQET